MKESVEHAVALCRAARGNASLDEVLADLGQVMTAAHPPADGGSV